MRKAVALLVLFYVIGVVATEMEYQSWHRRHCVMTDEARWNSECHRPTSSWLWPLKLVEGL